jgi:3-phenylpropionate/trans-cinnamate dioxygenase ferredoxin component
MTFHPVASLEDLAEGFPSKVDIDGTPVCLVRVGADVHAINDICSHGQVSLSEGEVDGCEIECWLHGSRFDVRTGEPLGLPATESVPVYPVRVEDGKVLVEVQEASL